MNAALARYVASLQLSPAVLAETIADLAAGELDSDTHAEMFAVLADASECGLVKRQAAGDPMGELSPGQLDVFARYARLADRMAAVRAEARGQT